MAILPIRRLIQVGSLHAHGALPDEDYQSFPIPVGDPRGLRLAFLYAASRVVLPLEGRQLFAPSYISFVSAEAGRFVELRLLRAGELGLPGPDDRPLGAVLDVDAWKAPEMLAKEARLYDAYDRVLPAFAARSAIPPTAELLRAAQDFVSLFFDLAETPLLPAYRRLGAEFFAWTSQAR